MRSDPGGTRDTALPTQTCPEKGPSTVSLLTGPLRAASFPLQGGMVKPTRTLWSRADSRQGWAQGPTHVSSATLEAVGSRIVI
jgi:hypothetical protein